MGELAIEAHCGPGLLEALREADVAGLEALAFAGGQVRALEGGSARDALVEARGVHLARELLAMNFPL